MGYYDSINLRTNEKDALMLARFIGLYLLAVFGVTGVNASELTSHQLLFDYQWKSTPESVSQFSVSKANLKQSWPNFHRATEYPFPDARYLSSLFRNSPELKQSIPSFTTTKSLASDLQSAWIAFFRGEFQKAAQQGYALGPIGLGVAFYSQVTYASRLESDETIRHQLWEDVINRHEKSKAFNGI